MFKRHVIPHKNLLSPCDGGCCKSITTQEGEPEITVILGQQPQTITSTPVQCVDQNEDDCQSMNIILNYN